VLAGRTSGGREAADGSRTAAQEAERRIQTRLRRLDVLARASRELERPLLVARRQTSLVQAREDFVKQQVLLRQRQEEEHVQGLARKAQLERVLQRRGEFEKLVVPLWEQSVATARAIRNEARVSSPGADVLLPRGRGLTPRVQAKKLYQEKLERARVRRDDALKQRKVEEEQARRAEMEAARIREAEEEIERRARVAAAAESGAADQGAARQAGGGPPQVALAAGASAARPGVWRPRSLAGAEPPAAPPADASSAAPPPASGMSQPWRASRTR
jgi:hypothetical protein